MLLLKKTEHRQSLFASSSNARKQRNKNPVLVNVQCVWASSLNDYLLIAKQFQLIKMDKSKCTLCTSVEHKPLIHPCALPWTVPKGVGNHSCFMQIHGSAELPFYVCVF